MAITWTVTSHLLRELHTSVLGFPSDWGCLPFVPHTHPSSEQLLLYLLPECRLFSNLELPIMDGFKLLSIIMSIIITIILILIASEMPTFCCRIEESGNKVQSLRPTNLLLGGLALLEPSVCNKIHKNLMDITYTCSQWG